MVLGSQCLEKSLTHGYPEVSHRALRWKLFWDSSRACCFTRIWRFIEVSYISMGKILGKCRKFAIHSGDDAFNWGLIRNVQQPNVRSVVRFVMRSLESRSFIWNLDSAMCFRNMGPKISGRISGQKMDRDFETKVFRTSIMGIGPNLARTDSNKASPTSNQMSENIPVPWMVWVRSIWFNQAPFLILYQIRTKQ